MNTTLRSLSLLLALAVVSCAEGDAPPPPEAPPSPGSHLVDAQTGRRYRDNPHRRILTSPPQRLPANFAAFTSTAATTDARGMVVLEIVACNDEIDRQHNVGIACSLDPDFVLTGGGASAEFGQGPGALLTESRPLDDNLATWVASSKDHLVADAHTLTVFAVGIMVRGMPREDLWAQMQLKKAVASAWEEHPTLSATVDSGFLLVGGGVSLLNTAGGPGVLLTGSFPSPDRRSWIGSGKDHVEQDFAKIEVYAIGVRPVLPGPGILRTEVVRRSAQVPGSGVGFPGFAQVAVRSGTLPVGPGAVSDWAPGQGRMLFAIVPRAGGVAAWDKDHVKSDGDGTVSAFAIQLWTE